MHAGASAKPSIFAKHLLKWRTGTFGGTRGWHGCFVFFDVFQSLDWRWCASNSPTSRERGRGISILARSGAIIASGTCKCLADSKVVIFGPTRAEVDVPFGLRMGHSRRLVALVVALFGWRLRTPCRRRADFPFLRFVEVLYLSVTLVIIEWIELREIAVRCLPILIQ